MAQTLLALSLILLLKWRSLAELPVWDTAMGLFPAAITLAGNGFDLIELLGMPAYVDGGPNVHSTSLVTLFTALVLRITGGGGSALVVLHAVQFLMAAFAISALYRFARPALGDVATALLCLCVLLHPLFLVQVGNMYLELPLFLCAVSALLAWTRKRFWIAVIWATLAFAVKEAGILVPATLATAALFEDRGVTARWGRIAKIVALPALWWGSVTLLQTIAATGETDSTVYAIVWVYLLLVHYLNRYLLNVPDIVAFFVFFLVTVIPLGPAMFRALQSQPPKEDDALRPSAELPWALSGVLILGFVVMFLFALPLIAQFNIILPRYCVIVLPFLLFWLGYLVQSAGRRFLGEATGIRLSIVMLASLSLFFVLNHSGRFYPPDTNTFRPGNDFALTERSHAYLRLNQIQKDAIAFLERLPDGVPIYYGHYEHYLFTYPELGYASRPLPNGHSLSIESLPDLSTGPPSCVYVLYNHDWLGGELMLELFELVESEPALIREVVREFRDDPYVITLYRVKHVDSGCTA